MVLVIVGTRLTLVQNGLHDRMRSTSSLHYCIRMKHDMKCVIVLVRCFGGAGDSRLTLAKRGSYPPKAMRKQC